MMKMKKINVTETIVAGIQLHIVQNGLRGSVILGGHVSTSGRRSRTFLGSFAGTCARIELFARAFQVEDWNRDFSLWEALAVFGTEAFAG